MWHFRIWFSRNGGVGWMVGLDDLRGLFQPVILWFSKGLPRGGQPVPAARAHLGPCSVAPEMATLQGFEEAKEGRQLADDGRSRLCAGGCGGNAAALGWQPGVEPIRHVLQQGSASLQAPPAPLPPPCLEPFQPQARPEEQRAPLKPPAIYLPPGKYLLGNSLRRAEQSCRVTPPPAKHTWYKSGFWNRKRLIIIL